MPARTLLVATAAFAAGVDVTAGATRSPLIILPGDGASALEAKLDKETKSHFYCAKTSDWYRLWADATQLAPGVVDCWAENIQLAYDVDADAVADAPGVTVRVVEGLAGLDLAGGGGATASNVYADLIDGLVDVGYERDVTVIGFPYDFRRAPVPGDATAMMARLVATIENATAAHGAPVTLVSHSLGCLNALYLLNTQPAAWRDAHIHAWVPVSPAYGGAVVDLVQFTSGDNEGIPWLSGPTLRDEQRSYESNVWLLPSAALYGADEALVTTPSRNYSAHDYEASDMCCFFTCLPSGRWHVHSGQAVTKCVISPRGPLRRRRLRRRPRAARARRAARLRRLRRAWCRRVPDVRHRRRHGNPARLHQGRRLGHRADDRDDARRRRHRAAAQPRRGRRVGARVARRVRWRVAQRHPLARHGH